ncbi:unnamed protein product [Arabis nemorensis]|uniref:Uncharacterized protein n=1 Tax=Arabis nemorensis TaxID=586526 RepID=A0A565BUH4_9BRAS|nr:unnamed protein product [Arabis nemorensis]
MGVTAIVSPSYRRAFLTDHTHGLARRNQPTSLGVLLRFWMFLVHWWEYVCISVQHISEVVCVFVGFASHSSRVERVTYLQDRLVFIKISPNYEDHTDVDSNLEAVRYGKIYFNGVRIYMIFSLKIQSNPVWLSLCGSNHLNLGSVITVIRRCINHTELIGDLLTKRIDLAIHLQKQTLRVHLSHYARTEKQSHTSQRFTLSIRNTLPVNMAFFGKMVAPRDERKRLSPIQMPDFDDSKIIKQFEKTLVGRVLNPKQTHRVKALIAFLSEVW